MERYNKVKIQYPGFTWDPPLIDIGTLVTLVQRAYPTQVVEYTLGCGKKSSLDTEDTVKHKVEEPAGLFPPTKPKVNNDYQESFRDFNEVLYYVQRYRGTGSCWYKNVKVKPNICEGYSVMSKVKCILSSVYLRSNSFVARSEEL